MRKEIRARIIDARNRTEMTRPELDQWGEKNPFWGRHHDEDSKQYNTVCRVWDVTFPDGHEETIFNLTRFCREHGLRKKRTIFYGHNGYRAKRHDSAETVQIPRIHQYGR